MSGVIVTMYSNIGNNSGCAFWYRKDPISTQWDLANSFPSPLYQNDSGFGYSVGVGVDSIAIGAYTQGSSYFENATYPPFVKHLNAHLQIS